MDGKGNAAPLPGAWSRRCLNYISHSAPEAQGCLCLALDTLWELQFKETGRRVSYWRVGSDQCAATNGWGLASSFGLAWNP